MEEMSSSACCRLLSNALAKLAKIDSGTSRSTTCSELSAYQHMLLVDLLVPLGKTHATNELSAYGLWCGRYGVQIKSRGDQISHTLPTTRHRCNLEVWALAQNRGDRHR